MNQPNTLAQFIPAGYFQRLADAANQNKLCMTLVVSSEAMVMLMQDKPVILNLEDGGAILLITQNAIEEIYKEQKKP